MVNLLTFIAITGLLMIPIAILGAFIDSRD